MFERRLYYHIDWGLLMAILALCGLAAIVSVRAALAVEPAKVFRA